MTLRSPHIAIALALLGGALPLRALDLTAYKQSNQILLGTVTAEVAPVGSLRLKSPASGLLHLRLPRERRAPLAAGTVWGEFDPERTRLEREALTLARALLDKKEQPRLRLDLTRDALDLTEKRSELTRQIGMFEQILADPDLSDYYLASGPAAGDTRSRDEIKTLVTRLRSQIELLDLAIAYAGTDEHLETESRVLDLKLRQHELDLERREEEKRLTMPFDGEVTLLVERPADDRPLRIDTGVELALIQDFSVLQARVVIKRPEWRLIPTSGLRLNIRTGLGSLGANFEKSRLDSVSGREELVYIFRFTPEDASTARSLVGGGITSSLTASLGEPVRIVPKLKLVLDDPEAFRDGDWQTGLVKTHPGARLIAIGETELAIAPAR